jgi:Tol biopolymer transport system component
VKTVRINHLRAALLAAAAAGLLAAVGLFVVVLYAQPAEANFPGKPGKIAFSGRDAPNGDYEIYTINANGGGKKPLTDNSSDDSSPSFSPSGKRIAYVNSTGTDSEIWTIQPNGGDRQQVTDNANNDRDPYWGSQ